MKLRTVSLSLGSLMGLAIHATAQGWDQDPQNSANWASETVWTGNETAVRKEYEYPPSGRITVTATYSRPYIESGSPFVPWTRNGVPIGYSLVMPFGKVIDEADTVQHNIQATATLKLTWTNPNDPAPANVRIWVRGSAYYEYSQNDGFGLCEDGLPGGTILTQKYPGDRGDQLGYELRTLTVSNGQAETEVEQESISSQAGPADTILPIWTWGTTTLRWGLDARVVNILMGGQSVYEPKTPAGPPAPTTFAYTDKGADWWTLIDRSFSYSYMPPIASPVPLQYSSTGNSAIWKIGVPPATQTCTYVVDLHGGPGAWIWTPPTIAPYLFTLTGHAATQYSQQEWSQWNNGTITNGWEIAPIQTQHVRPINLTYDGDQLNQTVLVANGLSESGGSVSLKYHWEDGTLMTAVRTLLYVLPVQENVIDLGQYVDWNMRSTPVTITTGYVDKAVPTTQSIQLSKPTYWKKILTTIGGIGGVADVAFGFAATAVAPELVAAAVIATTFGFAGSFFVEDDPGTITLLKNGYTGYDFEFWIDGDPNSPYRNTYPSTNFSITDFNWCVRARPRTGHKFHVDYVWGANGFVRADIDETSENESLKDGAPKMWQFVMASNNGGSGGSIGGGSNPG